MKIIWVIENFVKESSYTELIDAVKRAGHDLIVINGDYSRSIFNHLRGKNQCVIFNGSIQMTELLYQ